MDKDLILRAREEESAMANIIKRFENLIKKCLKIYIKNDSDMDDAMQHGKITVMGCVRTYDINSDAAFEAYVKCAVIYSIRDFARKIKEDMSLDFTDSLGRVFYEFIDSGIDLEGDAINKELRKDVAAAIKRLPENYRSILRDVYLKGISQRELARGRRCHYMTVVKMKDRALKKLKEEMGE